MTRRPHRAFSLIEVVIAIGIIAFTISSLVGLLALALKSDSSSASDTALSSMSQQIFNRLRTKSFSDLPNGTDAAPSFSYYFDVDGSETSGTNTTGAVFRCNAILTGDPNSPTTAKKVKLVFQWPCTVPAPPNRYVFQGLIADYGL
ncbi:MAG: hypothetical protein ACFUZC_08565 [Chthoniobacteraceae bacterium]